MHALVCLAAWFVSLSAPPFWEIKPPGEWSDQEIRQLLTESPWAQPAIAPGAGSPGVTVYLATARPVREAERRREAALEPFLSEEYRDFLEENRGRVIVLAIEAPGFDPNNEKEVKRVEQECILRIGRRRVKMSGYFPPLPADPYLRLAFPRALTPADKSLVFDLYLPWVPQPFRQVEFRIKDLTWRGNPEM